MHCEKKNSKKKKKKVSYLHVQYLFFFSDCNLNHTYFLTWPRYEGIFKLMAGLHVSNLNTFWTCHFTRNVNKI